MQTTVETKQGYIVQRECNCSFRTGCFICGEGMEIRWGNTLVYSDTPEPDYPTRLKNTCDVCDRCATSDPKELRRRIEEQAFMLEVRARELREFAARDIVTLTLEQLKKLEEENDALYADDAAAVARYKKRQSVEPPEWHCRAARGFYAHRITLRAGFAG